MFNWIKKLFGKKKETLVFYELSVQTHINKRYNVRDKMGRFTKKKGRKNGKG